MKPLIPAVLSLLVFSAVPLRAQVGVPEGSDSMKELKKKYASGGQKPPIAAGAPAEAAPAGAAAPAASAAPPAQGKAFAAGMPALYVRYVKGPDGYTLKQLTENMNWTEKNIGGLVDYIHPWRKGVEAPAGEDSAAAHKLLASESAAATELIADADAALAKGVPRDPLDPKRLGRFAHFYASRVSHLHRDPTPEQLLEVVASAQANVLGHAAALIDYKRLNPPDAEGEAKVEGWLEGARKHLAAEEKRNR